MTFLLVLLVLVTCLVFFLVLIYCFISKAPLEYRYDDRPSLFYLYTKALLVAFFRKQGSVEENGTLVNRSFKVISRDCRIEPQNLKFYKQVCLHLNNEGIPACYLETYFLPLLVIMASSEEFPLSPIGLIHIGQSITQHTSLEHLNKEPFDIELSVLSYRPRERGVEVDCGMRVYDRREMCVWEGVATFLSRNKSKQKVKDHMDLGREQTVEQDGIRKNEQIQMPLSASLGVRFAWASGDWNPHHLWGWTARMLGYKQPIAHGMWTLAACLAKLDKSGVVTLKPPFHVTARFKRPVFLPSTCILSFQPQASKDKYAFNVTDAHSGVPQLVGDVRLRT